MRSDREDPAVVPPGVFTGVVLPRLYPPGESRAQLEDGGCGESPLHPTQKSAWPPFWQIYVPFKSKAHVSREKEH